MALRQTAGLAVAVAAAAPKEALVAVVLLAMVVCMAEAVVAALVTAILKEGRAGQAQSELFGPVTPAHFPQPIQGTCDEPIH